MRLKREVELLKRGSVSKEEYPGITFVAEHFYGYERQIQVRYVVGSSGEYHTHDHPQFYYCVSGSFSHITREKVTKIGAGELVIVPPGELHTFDFDRNGEIINVNLGFGLLDTNPGELSDNLIAHTFLINFTTELKFSLPCVVSLSEDSAQKAKALLRPLADLKYARPSESWRAAIKGINAFFALPEFSFTEEKHTRVRKVRDEKLVPIMRTVVYMNKNFSKKIHCEDLLKISQMCRTDFYTLIKKTVGEKYSIYLQKIRVLRAHRALGFTDYSFSYIADMCGFGSVTYFGKCYKKYRGYTPKEERAALDELRERYSGIRISHEFFEPEEIENSQKPLDKPR